MQTINPLKTIWKIKDHQGDVGAIKDRVNSEDNLCWALGFPLIKSKDIKGRAGEPCEGKYESKGIGYQKNLMMFNKTITKEEYETQIKYLKAKDFKLPISKWVEYKDLSKDEQTTTAKQLGGFLKTLSYKNAWQQMWNEMKQEDRNFFNTLLNFNAEIFEGITGIKINNTSLSGKEVEVLLDGKTYKAIIQ